jgi:hypothetical protein
MAAPIHDDALRALEERMAILGVNEAPNSRSHAQRQKLQAREAKEDAGDIALRMCTCCNELCEGEDALVKHLIEFHTADLELTKKLFQNSKLILAERQANGLPTEVAEINLRTHTLRIASLEKMSPEGRRKLKQAKSLKARRLAVAN